MLQFRDHSMRESGPAADLRTCCSLRKVRHCRNMQQLWTLSLLSLCSAELYAVNQWYSTWDTRRHVRGTLKKKYIYNKLTHLINRSEPH